MKVWMAPAGLHIEPAQPGDEKDLAKLHAEGFFRGWTVADFQSYVRDTQTPIYVACDAKHRIAGFAMLRITGDECELMTIVVSKKFKGKRLSTALMQAMIEDLGQVEDLQKVTDVFQTFYLGTETQRGRFKDEVNLLRNDSPLFASSKSDTSKMRAVVTGRPRFEAKQGVAQLGITPAFVVSLDDVKNGKHGNLMSMGVIDPMKVTKSALQNAVSVAVTLLSTNAIVTMARSYETK